MNEMNTKEESNYLEQLEIDLQTYELDLMNGKSQIAAGEKLVQTAHKNIETIRGKIWEYHNLAKEDLKQGACARCFNFAGDEWDNTFRILFQHHPFCPYVELLGIRKKDFIAAFLKMETDRRMQVKDDLEADFIKRFKPYFVGIDLAKAEQILNEDSFLDDDLLENGLKEAFQKGEEKTVTQFALDLCYLIEKLPASPEQTDVITHASELYQKLKRIFGDTGSNQFTIFPDLNPDEKLDKVFYRETIDAPEKEMVKVYFDPNKQGREKIRAAAADFLGRKWGTTSKELVEALTQFFIQHVDIFRPKYISKGQALKTDNASRASTDQDLKKVSSKPIPFLTDAIREAKANDSENELR